MSKNKGFSLIEISIILVIISLLFSMIAANLYQIDTYKAEQTRKKIEIIKTSLMSFLLLNNRLPCPGDPTLPASDENSGSEACGCQGLRVEKTLNFSCISDYYLGGSIPVAALKLPENMMYDSWGNKFFYGVIEAFSGYNSSCRYGLPESNYSFDDCEKGFISIKDVNLETLNSEAVYVIFSFGPTGKGARDKTGNLNPLPVLLEEIKNYNATVDKGDFIILPVTIKDRTILAYDSKDSIMSKISFFTNGKTCQYARKIQLEGVKKICSESETISSQNCINYLSIMGNKILSWCIK